MIVQGWMGVCVGVENRKIGEHFGLNDLMKRSPLTLCATLWCTSRKHYRGLPLL